MKLLDVEGTTTPVSFVEKTLFPQARARIRPFLEIHRDQPNVTQIIAGLHDAWLDEDPASRRPSAWPATGCEAAIDYAVWLMEQDRKLTALKSLQGLVWEEAYREGHLVAPVYDDVAPALARWARHARPASIFSSGSVLAQRLLFGHTTAGDLTPLLGPLFDTTVGSKREPASYASIASSLRVDPGDVLFVSDIVAELDAAGAAGMGTALCVREQDGTTLDCAHPVVHSLAEVPLDA